MKIKMISMNGTVAPHDLVVYVMLLQDGLKFLDFLFLQ